MTLTQRSKTLYKQAALLPPRIPARKVIPFNEFQQAQQAAAVRPKTYEGPNVPTGQKLFDKLKERVKMQSNIPGKLVQMPGQSAPALSPATSSTDAPGPKVAALARRAGNIWRQAKAKMKDTFAPQPRSAQMRRQVRGPGGASPDGERRPGYVPVSSQKEVKHAYRGYLDRRKKTSEEILNNYTAVKDAIK